MTIATQSNTCINGLHTLKKTSPTHLPQKKILLSQQGKLAKLTMNFVQCILQTLFNMQMAHNISNKFFSFCDVSPMDVIKKILFNINCRDPHLGIRYFNPVVVPSVSHKKKNPQQNTQVLEKDLTSERQPTAIYIYIFFTTST